MKLPKNCKQVLHFRHKNIWYRIVEDNDKYILYHCGDTESDYEMLGTGSTPPKLEGRVYSGKLK